MEFAPTPVPTPRASHVPGTGMSPTRVIPAGGPDHSTWLVSAERVVTSGAEQHGRYGTASGTGSTRCGTTRAVRAPRGTGRHERRPAPRGRRVPLHVMASSARHCPARIGALPSVTGLPRHDWGAGLRASRRVPAAHSSTGPPKAAGGMAGGVAAGRSPSWAMQ